MAINYTDTGVSRLFIEAYETNYSAAENWSDISWSLYLTERVSSPTTWTGNDIGARVAATVNGADQGNLWAGSFRFDFRPGGMQTTVIASGTTRFGHNADGSSSVFVAGYINDTNTTAGGPASVGVDVPVTTLIVPPAVPFNVSAARVDDGVITLNWALGGDARGQATGIAIDYQVNDSAFSRLVDIGKTTAASVWAIPNTKFRYAISAGNGAGWAGPAYTNVVYTTPGAPGNVAAARDAALDIVVSFTNGVAYAEYVHEIQHGVVVNGNTTWDAGLLTTLPSGVLSYKHVAPNPAQIHAYRVRSGNGALRSEWWHSGAVQLLAAPAKPTAPAMAAVANKAAALNFTWVHNPVDSTPQKFYEFGTSVDGGSTWASSGKITATAMTRAIAANTYAANVALTTRVRTWGSATTGGSDSTGASPWSDLRTVTFKTIPTVTITTPTNAQVLNESMLRVTLSFYQAEAATFVKAQLELMQGATLLETMESNLLVGIAMATVLQNATSYTVRARVQDSNGLWSSWATRDFSVTYLAPVPAVLTVGYLPDTGFGQLNMTIAAPGGGQAAAATVSVTRTINSVVETIVDNYPAAGVLTFLDTTAIIRGSNAYTVTTKSALGATTVSTITLVTNELRRAFLSKGAGFDQVVAFGGNLEVNESLGVASDTIQAAGRTKPIGLYGVETTVQLKVQSRIIETMGSTVDQVRALLLVPGKACYRDSSGRRVFGSAKGSVAYAHPIGRGDLNFTLTETS